MLVLSYLFLMFTILRRTHNMFALMLGLHFRSLKVVIVFVEKAKVVEMVQEYDNKALMSLIVATF
jgi:hypothetical protein